MTDKNVATDQAIIEAEIRGFCAAIDCFKEADEEALSLAGASVLGYYPDAMPHLEQIAEHWWKTFALISAMAGQAAIDRFGQATWEEAYLKHIDADIRDDVEELLNGQREAYRRSQN